MMSFLEAIRWDVVGGGFQVALCAVILGGWLRRRLKKGTKPPIETNALPAMFSQEVLLQTIRQQTEQALQRISSAVEAERDKLQELLVQVGTAQSSTDAETVRSSADHAAFRWGHAEADRTDRNRYAGLKGLCTQGLSPRQIADQFNLPAGEIERELNRYGRPGA